MNYDPTIGIGPDHWEFITLGEVCSRGGGNIQTGPFGSQLHASDYVPVGVPAIMPVNIGDNRLVEDNIARITEADAERLKKHRVIPGDIIYSRRGDVERRALVRDDENGWFCGTGCLKVRLGKGVVDPLFASFYLGHPSVRQWIVRHAVGATMPNLNTKIMEAIPFALPPLPEQKAIANILGTLDDKIELNRRMNETLESMARALFKSWFVDFDPVRAKMDGRQPPGLSPEVAALFPDKMVHVDGELIPEGWTFSTIDECTSLIIDHRGKTPKKLGSDWSQTGIPAVSAKNIKDGRLIRPDTFKFVDEDLYARWMKDELQAGDILMTSEAPLGELYYLATDSRICLSQRLYGIRANPSVCTPAYLYYWLSSEESQFDLDSRATGTTVVGIRQSELRKVRVLIPSLEIQHRFHEILTQILNQIDSLEKQSIALANTRDTLLPKLLSGEVRVSDAETVHSDNVI
ncbi:restriction endonuclease subunit S [Blastopirellula marina]|uniref:Restriction endonuclease subunit S n=1 Tax=Blastopirellula marina TaxID=124 RepID=A0A2S8FM62_9BACT|nr:MULTISPECIES: restriction endonuclease subunit S [Pirellulaceae]PQO33288.1 restriction endonuclease subunit S [Blastopirellula marina]RCS52377.1 restriction endonuclease subunit S [Bremerella cremea]